MYKCIESFSIPKVDDDGFQTDEEVVVSKGSTWHLREDNYRFVGGEVRLESDELNWIEISSDTFENKFVAGIHDERVGFVSHEEIEESVESAFKK